MNTRCSSPAEVAPPEIPRDAARLRSNPRRANRSVRPTDASTWRVLTYRYSTRVGHSRRGALLQLTKFLYPPTLRRGRHLRARTSATALARAPRVARLSIVATRNRALTLIRAAGRRCAKSGCHGIASKRRSGRFPSPLPRSRPGGGPFFEARQVEPCLARGFASPLPYHNFSCSRTPLLRSAVPRSALYAPRYSGLVCPTQLAVSGSGARLYRPLHALSR